MTEVVNLAAPHEHPWAEDAGGRCVLCGVRAAADRLELHMRALAAYIEKYAHGAAPLTLDQAHGEFASNDIRPHLDWLYGQGYVITSTGAVANRRDEVLVELADLWREQVDLGTTQGGGRRYDEHCRQHQRAHELLKELDA